MPPGGSFASSGAVLALPWMGPQGCLTPLSEERARRCCYLRPTEHEDARRPTIHSRAQKDPASAGCHQGMEASLAATAPKAPTKERRDYSLSFDSALNATIPLHQGTAPGLVVAELHLGAKAPLPSSPNGALSGG